MLLLLVLLCCCGCCYCCCLVLLLLVVPQQELRLLSLLLLLLQMLRRYHCGCCNLRLRCGHELLLQIGQGDIQHLALDPGGTQGWVGLLRPAYA